MEYDPKACLLAKIYIPDTFPHVIYRRENWPGWAPDPSLFTLTRAGKTFHTFAAWEPYDSEILQGGQAGLILLSPLYPALWCHLRKGAPLIWAHEPFSAQIVEPIHLEGES